MARKDLRVSLRGERRFMRKLTSIVSSRKLEAAAKEGAEEVRDTARDLAPRKSGDLENAIRVLGPVKSGSMTGAGVGIPRGDEAYDRGMATEWGTFKIHVGDPENPRSSWVTKTKGSATMPWLRPALLRAKSSILKKWARSIFNRF